MGIGLIIPVMPDLLLEIEGGDLGNAAIWGGMLATVFAIMQFIFGPTIGSLSDRFGRRPILLVSLIIIAVDFIVMGLAHSVWLLVLTLGHWRHRCRDPRPPPPPSSRTSRLHERTARPTSASWAPTFGDRVRPGPTDRWSVRRIWLPRARSLRLPGWPAFNLVLGYFVVPETVSNKPAAPV